MYVCTACMCVYHVPGAHGGLRRVQTALQLELQMGMSCHVGAGNPNQAP